LGINSHGPAFSESAWLSHYSTAGSTPARNPCTAAESKLMYAGQTGSPVHLDRDDVMATQGPINRQNRWDYFRVIGHSAVCTDCAKHFRENL